ncbi:DNA alkylation repair protein [Streptomyces sp. NPDC090445]|uniref:DNA alkylation repair protein n=1 Tax=Streptomyces sp. NPDC090445 TaxID=3365963 RepID=UPI003827CCA5
MTVDDSDPKGPTEQLRTALSASADPVRAEQQRAYLRSDLHHLGVGVPDMRRSVTRTRRALGARPAPYVLALAAELWSGRQDAERPVYEYRWAAVELLVQYARALDATHLPAVEALLRECHTWALVDPLAVHCAGVIALRDPAAGPVLDRWVADPDFWLRRSALLALLPAIRTGRPDGDRLTRYADALVDEREFFLRKALGWVLRETSTRDPGFVIAWVERNGTRVAPLTRKEALRRLPPEAPRQHDQEGPGGEAGSGTVRRGCRPPGCRRSDCRARRPSPHRQPSPGRSAGRRDRTAGRRSRGRPPRGGGNGQRGR